MLTKAQMYSQMAEHVSSHITSSFEGWTSFLTTASKNYKYPYYDQLMIHAQRPDATACAEYDFWNDRMGRYVKRGSKGIALVDNSGEYPRLRYVFDISDTGTRQNSRKVRLWSMQDEYKEPIKQALEKRYGISSERLETQLEDIARQRANDYWNDFGEQFFHILDESFLMEYDEYNIEVAFKKAATVSITYMLYSRLTDNPNDYFEFEDFKNIFDFNTSQTANYLGTAVSEISSQIFREIEVTIRNYEQQLERSKNHDERTRIQTGRRLFNSEHRTDSDRTQTTGQIRQNEENFYQGKQVDVIQSPDFNREVVSTSVGNRRNSQPQIGTDDARTSQSSRSNRTTESQQSNGMGGLDEQLQSSSGGNNSARTDLQLSLFPSEQEQIKIIDEAENLVFSAFSFAQKDIDNVLRVGGNTDNLRKIVVSAFEKQKPDIPDLLKTVYHGGNGFITDSGKITVWYAEDGIHLSRTNSARYDKSAQIISWKTASERIGELLESGNYATNVELAESESFERTELAQKLWYLYHDLSDDVKKTEILSSISNINLSNFPSATENLAEKLKDSSFRNVLTADYEQFLSAYKQNQDVLRFHYHKTEDIISAIKDLDLPRKQFTTDMTEIEDVKQFITDDEIDVSLSGGSGFSDGKKRIYEFFTQNHDSKEKTEFLKNEYGTGGRSPALSGASGSSENHDYKGIKYQKKNCEDITLTWERVSKRIDELISKEIYKEEKSEKQEQIVQTELSNEDFINKHLIAGETTLTLENRVFQVESVNLENDKVELRDITFAQSTGFPIFRIENIETMRRYLENQPEHIKALEPILTDNIAENFHITDFHLGEGGAKAKFRANIDAIRTLQTIESENRTATKEEQEILSKYVGWGGLSDAFDDTKESWSNEYNELKIVLSADEYNAARASTLNAHYTSPTIIKAIYDALDNMGFKSGNILEPSCGVGNFFGMLPEQMSDSKLHGVELDSITGRIAKQLYPKADITVAGFETTDRRDFYDLAIGNVPFGQYQVNDKAYNNLRFNIHNYFFAKSLDQIRSGGIIAFVTSRYTMDAKDSTVRRYIAQRAELLGAIRLPNNAFKANAGTEVVSDIIFLQKRDRPIDIVPDWTKTAQTEDGFTINSYFAHNPQMILGTNEQQSTAHGMDYTVSPIDGAAYTTYGTERANAYKILEDSLNLRDVRIYDTIQDADGKERRVLNAKETTLASQKQQAIREAFKDWIWKDPERRQALVHQYNEEMNSTRPREYDGSHITFGGMNPEITLREHQKNAIAHVLYGGNTLLAHEVGAGKTFEMVASAMESKRLGLCQKSLFVVPNHLTEQWASEFLRLYPSANILVTTKKDFEPHNRKKFCARIATGSYDAVIIGHSQFEKIPISRERQERLLNEQIEEITDGIAEVKYSGGERFTVKQLERTKKSLETRLEKLQAEERKDDVVTFEQLGVDRLFVDESHAFKNLFLYTKMRNVAGLSTSDAQKSSDMFAKCRYMDEITGNRGVIFATGTPVSNSMTELYTIQRYLQYDRLKELGMTHFDCWASRFGETVTALELAPEGTGYRARTRFSKFFNLPELMNLFKEVADIKTSDQLNLPTPEVKYHNIVAQPTEHQKEMVKALSERAAEIHSGTVDPSTDNMLKVTSDGRKLGLDQRIINPMLPDEDNTKVNQCVDNIMQIWRDGAEEKLTQVVFCDISTPQTTSTKKSDEKDTNFTVYDDIRQKLIANGMPAEQIEFIHDANTEARKKELFGKVRSGQVRVLMGSTQKMGVRP